MKNTKFRGKEQHFPGAVSTLQANNVGFDDIFKVRAVKITHQSRGVEKKREKKDTQGSFGACARAF